MGFGHSLGVEALSATSLACFLVLIKAISSQSFCSNAVFYQ